jgi:hypothetical protein
MSTWRLEGQYFEICNCEYLCPCISSNLTARPTEGDRKNKPSFLHQQSTESSQRWPSHGS